MDDTVWHCEHPETLQNILNDASALYELNNIEVNPTKSDLLHISPKNSKTSNHVFFYNNKSISPRKPEDTIRYLGIFYDGKGSTKPTLDTLYNKIENFLLLIRYKKLLPSQISSLFNLILQPSLEYLLQIIPIQKNTQTKLSRLLSIQTKKMLSLAKNTNNISLTNPLTFNLPTLTNIIQKVSISNAERTFNTLPLLHNIGILRIKSWLSKIWFPKLNKETLLTHYRKTQNYTLLFHLSQLARNNITISLPFQITNYPSFLSEHSLLIYNILPPTPNYLTINSLKNNKILFIEQITTANNNSLLPWNNIYLRTNKATKGRQPSWFTRLLQIIQTNSFQITWPHLYLPPINSFINTTDLIPSLTTKFPFQLSLNNQDINFLHQQTLIYEIYQLADQLEGQTSLIESIHTLSNSKLINLLYKQIKFNRSLLQIDFKEILAIIDIFNNLNLPTTPPLYQPQINILSREIQLIYHIIESSYYQYQLTQIHNNILNLSLTNLQFATDASIQNVQSSNIRSSIGWICENNPSIKFNALINPSPDSSRSEMIAIIPLLLVVSISSTITIYTDSLITIKNLLNPPSSKLTQLKNWDIIFIINSIKSTKNISINFSKVKSHSTNPLHNQADLLAKQGSTKPLLTISYTYFNLPIHFSWNNHTITLKARSFIKNIITIQELISWSSLKLFNNYTLDINWNLTFKILNTLENNSHKYSFYIKILANNLPTMQNLNIRYPNLYTTNKCCKCPQIEDSLHLLLCSKNTGNIQQSLINITTNTLQQLHITSIQPTLLLNTLSLPTTNSLNTQYNSLIPIILGIYPRTIYQNIKTLLKKQTEPTLINLSNNLLHWFYHEIWFKRNTFQHQWESARNITPKTKRTKFSTPLLTNQINLQSSNLQPIDPHDAIEKWYLQGFSLTTCFL